MPGDLTSDQKEVLLRWRLCLGRRADGVGALGVSLGGLGMNVASGTLSMPAWGLDGRALLDLDAAMEFIYGEEERSASLGGSNPYLPPELPVWLANLRRFFTKDVVAVVQRDAIERKGLQQLLFERETLPYLEKNVELVTTLLAAKDMIPSKAKAMAREVVAEIVERLMEELRNEVRQVLLGALTRSRHSPLPVYRNIDWKRTIRSGLKNYDSEAARIIPERVYFWGNQKRFHEWRVILAVDQSGSMGTSVVYSSVMAAIFASLPVLETNLIFFDTEVVDMTDRLTDPVDVIFGAQLGGGTDIAKAVTYASGLVTEPERTIFILISDLFEGGVAERLLAKLSELKESKVQVVCLLALTDGGAPAFDRGLAGTLRGLDIPAFACTPRKLVDVMGRILKGVPFDDLATPEAKG